MALGHERLDVYRLAIGYVAWVYEKSATLEGIHRAARDQWLKASQSIPIPIAIAIWMRPSPNKAVEATGYRRLTADDGYGCGLNHLSRTPEP
jgi:hypothetical protein